MDVSRLGFGVTGNLDESLVRWLAVEVEAAGFQTLWFNDTPGGDSLARVRIATEVTRRIRFGTGVIPMDRLPAKQIVEHVRALALPESRLLLGVGSGATPRAESLALVKSGLEVLREGLGSRIIVGALGPKMRKLGAQESDGVLLNWLTPESARQAQEQLKIDSADAGKTDSLLVTYVRVAFGEDALPVLQREAQRYSQVPGYAANFARLGISAIDAAIYGTTPESVQRSLVAYEGTVDEIVIRAITASDSIDDFKQLLSAITA